MLWYRRPWRPLLLWWSSCCGRACPTPLPKQWSPLVRTGRSRRYWTETSPPTSLRGYDVKKSDFNPQRQFITNLDSDFYSLSFSSLFLVGVIACSTSLKFRSDRAKKNAKANFFLWYLSFVLWSFPLIFDLFPFYLVWIGPKRSHFCMHCHWAWTNPTTSCVYDTTSLSTN